MATKNSINNKTGPLTITDSTDITKEVAFVVSGVTTATTRTWTVDDRNIDFDAVATSVVTDSGTCTPAAGSFSIVGGSGATTSASGSTITVTSSGAPAMAVGFLAYLGTQDANATGDGTVFTLGSGNALTEVYDIGSDFVTTGTFTAPNTGKYRFDICVTFSDIASTHTSHQLTLNTSNRNFQIYYVEGGISGSPKYHNGTITADMDASDTATVTIRVAGGTKVVDIDAGASPIYTWFSGNQIG